MSSVASITLPNTGVAFARWFTDELRMEMSSGDWIVYGAHDRRERLLYSIECFCDVDVQMAQIIGTVVELHTIDDGVVARIPLAGLLVTDSWLARRVAALEAKVYLSDEDVRVHNVIVGEEHTITNNVPDGWGKLAVPIHLQDTENLWVRLTHSAPYRFVFVMRGLTKANVF